MTIPKSLGISLPSPLQHLPNLQSAERPKIDVYCKRDDLIHPLISGNKWRKLAGLLPTLLALTHSNKPIRVLSFGGAYSNHLHALAFLCFKLNIQLVAIIRGHYAERLTPTLIDIQQWQTETHFVDKTEYKKRDDTNYLKQLTRQFELDLIIPEGGSSEYSIAGLARLGAELNEQICDATHILLPVASGGTIAGLLDYYVRQSAENATPTILGIGVLKGKDYLEQLVEDLLPSYTRKFIKSSSYPWQIAHDFHHGGYAKKTEELSQFIKEFERDNDIKLEPIYSGKCFFALQQLVNNDFFPEGSKVVILHTGGLQGLRK